MTLEIVLAQPEHVAELSKTNYAAFKDLADSRNLTTGFPSSEESSQGMYRGLITDDIVHFVAALLDSRVVGSAWLHKSDEVAAIEDVNVHPSAQGKGVGRAIMENMVGHARELGYEMIRLTQTAYNLVSLSLYVSLGFEVKDTFVEMKTPLMPARIDGVRPLAETDLTAIEVLSKQRYRVSRRADVVSHMKWGGNGYVLESGGTITGYFVSGGSNHGVAQSEKDALGLLAAAAADSTNGVFFNCPLSQSGLYRKALEAGCRATEIHNLMALGPYERPEGVWMPSGGY